jgi:anti-sigma B factor antagonist
MTEDPMSDSASGTAAEGGQPLPGAVRLAGLLTLSCSIGQAGETRLTFAGELDVASADQAYGYVKDAIDAHGGTVMLDVAELSFCDARGLGALTRMSRHAEHAGASLHLVAPQPLLVKIIRITGLDDKLPVYRGDRAGQAALARPRTPMTKRDQFATRRRVTLRGPAACARRGA